MKEETHDMPEEIWAIIHCGAHGWTIKEDVEKNAYISDKYIRALANLYPHGLRIASDKE